MDPPEADVDALFASPLEDFIAERDRLAKDLSASGEKDAARSVMSLRKPSVVVWTLNQLARTERDRLQALFATGESMRLSLEQGDPKGARGVQADRRSQLKRLGDAASELLRAGGHAASPGHVEKVRSILLQATTDHDLARAISEGRLTKEPTGDALPDAFEGLGLPRDDPAEDARATRRRRRLQERVEELRSEAETASRQAARLARDAASARLAADAAEDVATAAQRAADRTLKHLEDAEKELRDRG
jgi:hypothetical protein